MSVLLSVLPFLLPLLPPLNPSAGAWLELRPREFRVRGRGRGGHSGTRGGLEFPLYLPPIVEMRIPPGAGGDTGDRGGGGERGVTCGSPGGLSLDVSGVVGV